MKLIWNYTVVKPEIRNGLSILMHEKRFHGNGNHFELPLEQQSSVNRINAALDL